MDMTVTMTEQDFEQLTVSSMRWGVSWEHHFADGRFEDMTPGVPFDVLNREYLKYTMAYWTDDDWTKIIFLRSFLDNLGHTSVVLWDMGMENYCVLTNYKTQTWFDLDAREAKNGSLLHE